MGKEKTKTTLTKVARFLCPPLASLSRELEEAKTRVGTLLKEQAGAKAQLSQVQAEAKVKLSQVQAEAKAKLSQMQAEAKSQLSEAKSTADQAAQAAKAKVDALLKEHAEAKNQLDQLNEAKNTADKQFAEQQAYIAQLLEAQSTTELHGNGGARIGILSGYYPSTRFNSTANHRLYADQHGYSYIFDSAPRYDTRSYMRKLEAVLEYLDLFDWLFWIDDDAYFTDFSVRLESFIEQAPGAEFIVCKSPSTKKLFTMISSGQFLIRNTPRAKQFIADALRVELPAVKAWWTPELGMYTGGDQDALVYLMKSNPSYAPDFFAAILDHQQFNNRPFEYEKSLDEHFVVHFTGKQKLLDKAQFSHRLGCNEFLCPPDLLNTLAIR